MSSDIIPLAMGSQGKIFIMERVGQTKILKKYSVEHGMDERMEIVKQVNYF